MKKEIVKRLLCIAVGLSMCITNTAVLLAYDGEQRLAVYEGKEIMVTVSGESVILEDGTAIPLQEFSGQFIETEPLPAPEEPLPELVPEEPLPEESEPVPEEPGAGSMESDVQEPETGNTDNVTTEPGNENSEVLKPEAGSETQEIGVETKETLEPEAETGECEEGQAEPLQNIVTERTQLYLTPSITAGLGFYIEELESKYHLTFEEEFKDVVSEIEMEFEGRFIEELEAAEEQNVQENAGENAEGEAGENLEEEEREPVRFTNWQDVLAVYLLNERRAGADTFIMDSADREGITDVFT